jgi:hypothetical protein
MRVSTLIVLLLVAGLGVLAFLYRGQILDQVRKVRNAPAETPAVAMEMFRDAIIARNYDVAALYCTKDYADLLVKVGPQARTLGQIIDDVRNFMTNKSLTTDQAILILNRLDPFPPNFKVHGAVKPLGDKEAVGWFTLEALPWQNPVAQPALNAALDPTMFSWSPGANIDWSGALRAPQLFDNAGVKLVKEGEGWKLAVSPIPAQLDAVRDFLDRAESYTSELGTFRTYMTNNRYDSPRAFEVYVVEALGKCKR